MYELARRIIAASEPLNPRLQDSVSKLDDQGIDKLNKAILTYPGASR